MKEKMFSREVDVKIAASHFIKERDYWMNKLSGLLERSYFHYDYRKTGESHSLIDMVRFTFNRRIFSKLSRLTNGLDPKLHMVLVAGVIALISKYTGSSDIIVGTAIDKQETEGELVNTILPLRTQIHENMTFKELLLEVRKTIHEAIDNQNYPMEHLVSEMSLTNTGDFLFDIPVLLENIHDKKYIAHIPFDMVISFLRKEEDIEGVVEYDPSLYKKETIQRIIQHFITILEEALIDVDKKVNHIDLLSEEEKKRILDFNETRAPYPEEKTIHALFEEQTARTPDHIALAAHSSTHPTHPTQMIHMSYMTHMTYKELNEKANQLAHLLIENGIQPGSIVGIMAERSIEMIIGILGILKAGGAFLPIGPDYPKERNQYILSDSNAKLLLTTRSFTKNIDFKKEIIYLDDYKGKKGIHHSSDQFIIHHSDSLAYIIYTSGSTGNPKGVMIEHRGLVNYTCWAAKKYVKGERVDFPLHTTLSFDLTITSIFVPLITGNAIVITGGDPHEILAIRIIEENNVGVVKLTPTHLKVIRAKKVRAGSQSNIKRFIVGGEELDLQLAKDISENFNGNIEIYNEYGPTEAVVGCMIHKFDPVKDDRVSVPIGVPADNVRIHILDKYLKPLPPGISGEIYIAGDGLARGYLNKPGLTIDKFVPDPFEPGKGKRMYKTGDLAGRLPGGNVEFLGRIDQQVKIKGYRIELGEIENHLQKNHNVKEVIVTVREDEEGDKYLAAYCMLKKSAADNISAEAEMLELREHLSMELPEYMIPSYFVPLDRFPLTPNGKIDRKALPKPSEVINSGFQYSAPRNEIEETLVKVWGDVLGVEQLGIEHDYFALGGDSIKAIQITARLKKFKLNLELSDLFQFHTIKDLSPYVTPVKQVVPQDTIEGEVKLTPVQKWFFEKKRSDMHHFNQSVILFNPEGFNGEIVETVFHKLVEHHDALRMTFEMEDGKVKQINRGITGGLIDMEVKEIKEQSGYKTIIEEECNRIQGSIDLSSGPLVKVGLFKTVNGDYLLVAIHHLVMDTVSYRILIEDFEAIYKQIQKGEKINIPLKSTSYKEWAEKLYEYSNKEELLEETDYWKEIEQTHILPLQKEEVCKQNIQKNLRTMSFELSKAYTEKLLKEVNRAYNTEINDILLSALGLALKAWRGIGKNLISLEGHGRENIIEDVDITRTVGWFTSVYPVILDMETIEDISSAIKRTKDMLRRIPNKGIGCGIIKYLTEPGKKNGMVFNLKPEIGFNYLGQFDQDIQSDLFQPADISPGNSIGLHFQREHVLEVIGLISEGLLRMSIDFNNEAYDEKNISALVDHYETRLKQIIDHCVELEKPQLTLSDLSSPDFDEDEVHSIFDELKDTFGD
jgi:iturin family lipopeptide synthetase C